MKTVLILFTVIFTFFLSGLDTTHAAKVRHKDGKVFIKDRRGELWDVTQAQSLGFKPSRFQYGIGKYAFTPLEDEDLDAKQPSGTSNMRVIGITAGNESHAYSVDKLRGHEIANTTIAGTPITAGY